MKILTLQVSNFRQFYGESPILQFAHGQKNVTVIHGNNGSGKTALLNAFTWAFYNETSRGFQLPDQLVNKRAIREAANGAIVEAWVEVHLAHGTRKYCLRRLLRVRRTEGDPGWQQVGEPTATLTRCDLDGKWRSVSTDSIPDEIGLILPEDLHSYFFFDGERIERIVQVSPEEQKALGEAVKKLLGIEVLIRAENHLGRVRRDFDKELSRVGTPEAKKLLQAKAEADSFIEESQNALKENEHNIEVTRIRKEEIEGLLRKHGEVREFQERRDFLKSEHAAQRDSITSLRNDLGDLLSKSGHMLLLKGPIKSFQACIDELKQRGELPVGIKRQLVDKLLDSNQCICGRDLPENSPPRRDVEEWKARAGLSEVEETAIRMGGELNQVEISIPLTLDRLRQIRQQVATKIQEKARIESELDSIEEKLRHSPLEEVSDLEKARAECERTIEGKSRSKGTLEERIRLARIDLETVNKELSKIELKEERQKLIRRRADGAQEAQERISQVRELLETDYRRRLHEKVRDLFATMSVTPYFPEIATDWSLKLLESAGGTPLPVAASQGESQILSLALIGSLIEMTKEFAVKRDKLPGPESAEYPIVMDSPFGSLDPRYRAQIAEHIPQLADQVILMATRTQWRGEVEECLAQRTGRAYVLTYYTPREDVEPDKIALGKRSYDLVRQSPNEYEFTEIVEVEHA